MEYTRESLALVQQFTIKCKKVLLRERKRSLGEKSELDTNQSVLCRTLDPIH